MTADDPVTPSNEPATLESRLRSAEAELARLRREHVAALTRERALVARLQAIWEAIRLPDSLSTAVAALNQVRQHVQSALRLAGMLGADHPLLSAYDPVMDPVEHYPHVPVWLHYRAEANRLAEVAAAAQAESEAWRKIAVEAAIPLEALNMCAWHDQQAGRAPWLSPVVQQEITRAVRQIRAKLMEQPLPGEGD